MSQYYHSAGIAFNPATYDSLTEPFAVIDSVTAPSFGNSYNTLQAKVTTLPPGTYIPIHGWTRAANMRYYPVDPPGGISITITDNQRPSNWNWTNSFVSGQNINITATEWNNFCSRINEFRRYRGYGNYSFTQVSRNQDMRASVANEARAAIQGISGYGAYIPYIYSGNNISVSYFNTLRSELNSII